MKIYYNTQNQTAPTAVALGYFDGIHIGHQKIINKASEFKAQGLTPAVFTFLQSPKSVICKSGDIQIMTFEEKADFLEKSGIEILYAVDFLTVQNYSAEEFVEKILKNTLNAKKVVCGFNYHFGNGGISGAEDLTKICKKYGIKVLTVSPVLYENAPVSSTRIRNAVKSGNFKTVHKMLGK